MNLSIPCVIVDDNLSAIDILKEHISEIPTLVLGKTYTKPVVALSELILEHQAQLVFMDIDMPTLSGISLADNLKGQPHNIIFTTSYDEYAIQAFKVRAKHYLLKPFNLAEFAKVVNDVIKECYDCHNIEQENSDAFFLRASNDRSKIIKVFKDDIIYFQGSNNHIHIYTQKENYSVYLTISEMSEKLIDHRQFYRIHKSYILNIDFIKNIVGNKIDLGKYEVLMASHYKKDFMIYVQNNLLSSKRN